MKTKEKENKNYNRGYKTKMADPMSKMGKAHTMEAQSGEKSQLGHPMVH